MTSHTNVDKKDILETIYLEPDLSSQETIFEILPDGTKSLESNLKESASLETQSSPSGNSLQNVLVHLESASIQLSQLHFVLSQLEHNQLLEVTGAKEETQLSAPPQTTFSTSKRPEEALMKQASFIKSAKYIEERYEKLSKIVKKQQGILEQFVRLRQSCTGIRIFTSGLRVQGSVLIDEKWYNLSVDDPEEKYIEKHDIVESSFAMGPGKLLGAVKFPYHLYEDKERNHEQKILFAISRARFFAFQRRAFRCLVHASKDCNHILYYYQNRVHIQIYPNFHVEFGLVPTEQVSSSFGKWEALSYLLCEWTLSTRSLYMKDSLSYLMKGGNDAPLKMDKLLNILKTIDSTEQLQATADRVASHFGLKLEWLYGKELGQVEVKFTALKTNGIGPQVLLGTAILQSPNIWFTPTFRVYCQGVLEVLQVSSTYQWSWISPEEDYPPSFECPISQLSVVIALLLCGRLLNSLELVARCNKYVFEVDRQGLALSIRGRRTFVTLWLEVVPHLEKHGEIEEIIVNAYLNGEYVDTMKSCEVDALSWFYSLLHRLDMEDKRIFMENVK